MTATYSGDPSSTTRDAARFWLGDTDVGTPLFSDAEIDFLLVDAGDVPLLAAAAGADQLAMRYGRRADTETNGDVSVTWKDLASRMTALAGRLRALAADSVNVPSGAGLADPDAYERGPEFWIGQFDSERSTALDYRPTPR